MSTIAKNRMEMPIIGATGNWGSALNKNFQIIDGEISKIYSSINGLQQLVGANVPYIKVDEALYFVIIRYVSKTDDQLIDGETLAAGSYILYYFPKKTDWSSATIAPEIPKFYFNNKPDQQVWKPSIPNFTAAYVVGFTTDFTNYDAPIYSQLESSITNPGAGMFDAYRRGDLMVAIQEFSSTYGDNIIIEFKKYPPMGEYYKPDLAAQTPYELCFDKTDYVTWFVAQRELKYTLPSIGMGTFTQYNIADAKDANIDEDGTWTITQVVAQQNDQLIHPQVNWFLQGVDGSYESIMIAYTIHKQLNDTNYIITVKTNTRSIPKNYNLICEIYYTHQNV